MTSSLSLAKKMTTILFFQFLLISSVICQETVFVKADQIGCGILKTRGNECFVVLPEHVLKSKIDITEDYYGPVHIYGQSSVKSKVTRFKTFIGDLAIMKFESEVNQNCVPWKMANNFQDVISVITTAKLEIREKTGEVRTIPCTIRGLNEEKQVLTVIPSNFRDEFEQGMSGSSLFTDHNGQKVYLGMLQTVDTDEGEGNILLVSKMEEIMASFFDPPKQKRSSGGGVSLGETRTALGCEFELIEVRREGGLVELGFDVTSQKEDKELRLTYKTMRLYDEYGKEYLPFNILMGGTTGYSIRHKLIHNVTVPLVVQFKDISSSATVGELLSIQVAHGNEKSDFEIRDLLLPNDSGSLEEDGAAKEKVAGGIKFELLHVDKTGTDVSIKLVATSTDKDRELTLQYKNILMYDDKGSEVRAKNIVIANKESYTVRHRMIHGVAIPVEIQFIDVSSSAEAISLLNIGLKSDNQETMLEYRGLEFAGGYTSGELAGEERARENACSNVYIYWMKGFMQCEEQVYVTNHGEPMVKLKQGERYKTVVCSEMEYDFAPKNNLKQSAVSVNRGTFELGNDYYFKIGCTMGYSKITLQKRDKGVKNLDKKGKYVSKLKTFKIKEL